MRMAAYVYHWLPSNLMATGVRIDVDDPDNLQGYAEACCFVAGPVFTPVNNVDYGASMTYVDGSTQYRTSAYDLLSDLWGRARKMQVPLSDMPPADRTTLSNMIRANGTSWPMMVSLFPGSADLELERDHTIYGKFPNLGAIGTPQHQRYGSALEFLEI